MGSERTVDVVVIGGGPVGENAAARTAAAGLRTVLVEHELLGGECSYWACMPSKALLRPVEAVSAARHVRGADAAVTGRLDASAVFERRDSFTSHWDDSGQVEWAEGAGIEVVRGHGVLAGERAVEVTGDDGTLRLTATQAVVVATGSVPSEPPIDGLAGTPHWSSRDATSSHAVPASLAVLGGGVVGSEMAQAYTGFGSDVTLIGGRRLLERAEPFAGEMLADSLREQGASVLLGSLAQRVESTGTGVRVTLADGSTVEAEQLLVATGRRPGTRNLGVESVGLTPGDALAVDDQGRVDGRRRRLAVRRRRRQRPRPAHPPGQVPGAHRGLGGGGARPRRAAG